MGVATAPRRGGNTSQRGGAAAKRKARTDRDGDIAMDTIPQGSRVRGGGISKRGRGGAVRDGIGQAPLRDLITNPNTQQRILRQAAEGTFSRGPRAAASRQSYKELKVTGWDKSKAASNQDRGISSLTGFLERKATQKKGSEVRIKKTHVSGNTLFVYASEADVNEIVKLNTFTFAGVQLTIEKTVSREGTPSMTDASTDQNNTLTTTSDTRELLRGVLERRYNAEHKLLNLSALAEDEALKTLGVFQSVTTESKFFPALMKICDEQFKTAQEKRDTIQGVVLSSNGLRDVKAVTSLAATLPHIKNLDLSNNQFADLDSLQAWKHRFKQLDHLIVTGNPLETVPDFNIELMKWYPTLRLLNGIQVRTEAEIAAQNQKSVKQPPTIKAPIFRDEAQIAESFIRTFFQGYDTDRTALANMYYDTTSTFSMNVNTHALRDPNATEQDKPQPHEWEAYIKKSRNFKKITHLPARISRLFVGTKAIADAWQSFPVTKHLSIDTSPQNWLFECHPLPGVPDPTGQSPTGVNGFLVTLHGEFYEISPSNGQQKHRSFDRTFILGPGGSTGVRVVSDTLVIRSYGGFAAFVPEPEPLSPEAQMEAKVIELAQNTRLQLHIAKQCLEESGWDMATAVANFERAKATLPPDAFITA